MLSAGGRSLLQKASQSRFPSERLHWEGIPWGRCCPSLLAQAAGAWLSPKPMGAASGDTGLWYRCVCISSTLTVTGGTRALGTAGSGAGLGCPLPARKRVAAGEREGVGALPAPRGLREEHEGMILCFVAIWWLLFRGNRAG